MMWMVSARYYMLFSISTYMYIPRKLSILYRFFSDRSEALSICDICDMQWLFPQDLASPKVDIERKKEQTPEEREIDAQHVGGGVSYCV